MKWFRGVAAFWKSETNISAKSVAETRGVMPPPLPYGPHTISPLYPTAYGLQDGGNGDPLRGKGWPINSYTLWLPSGKDSFTRKFIRLVCAHSSAQFAPKGVCFQNEKSAKKAQPRSEKGYPGGTPGV